MANRKIAEVDASSIADIAFILLAFIIVVTTLEKEEGVPAVLPQKNESNAPPPVVKERNILQIAVNRQNQLMIENEWDQDMDDIKPAVVEFMTNPTKDPNLPIMDVIDITKCKTQIAIYKQKMEEASSQVVKGQFKDKMEDWEKKLETVRLIGTYETLPKAATIAIQYDKGTSYGTYLGVRDQVMAGVNELRNRKSKELFDISYNELDAIRQEVLTEEDEAKIKAIREVYPQKIIDLVRNVGE